ncbi:hypothetical protein LCI18_008848 [Fusarium solani-melongenae]|uniref:Uncharacterized protein n=1 Tax=Fusarium solani subsp. cucurbitae TaxID=2747967 RepID=A0ACD3Z9H1_FUSSC|nr:hypothetical protein LCI18_008848 [Fusarium solani-melongenae]
MTNAQDNPLLDDTSHSREFCSRLAILGRPANPTSWALNQWPSAGLGLALIDNLIETQATPLWHIQVPIFETPPRRKVVWVWICVSSGRQQIKLTIHQCYCGHGGMKVSVDPCPRCGVQRCPNCETQRFNTRYEYKA